LIDTEEGHLLIENFVNIFFVTPLSVSLHNLLGLNLLQQIITTTTTMTIATIQPVTIPPITPPLLKCQQNHYQTNVTKLGYQSENVLYIYIYIYIY
jgi:hypothetical protein